MSPVAIARHHLQFVALGLVCALATSCDDPRHGEIRRDIHVIVTRNDALVPAAIARLQAQGPLALTQIESAMHSASSRTRLRFIQVMGAITHPDTVALLRHWALYATEADVRTACDAVLARWSSNTGERGDKARAAQEWLASRRAPGGTGPVTQ